MKEVKQTRMIQLAATLLLRLNEQVKIFQANSSLYDIIIVTPIDRTECLVKIVDEEFMTSVEWMEYQRQLQSEKVQDSFDGRPLLLLKLDEIKLELYFHLLGWDNWGEYIIECKTEFHFLDGNNVKTLFDEIRKHYHVIKLLDVDNVKVVKQIKLSEDVYGHRVPADIVYFRDFTDNYKITRIEPSNEEERREKERFVHLQKEYPNDILDDGILKAVRIKHPNAEPWNSLLVSNTDYRKWSGIQRRLKHEEVEIRILPNFDSVPTEMLAFFNGIEAMQFRLDVYFEPVHIEHLYDNEGYELRLPLNGWVNTLNKYSEVLNTMRRVKDLV